MPLDTVAIMSPGDMGHAVGAVLARHGARVITVLADRGAETRRRAAAAGIEDAGDDAALMRTADVVLSIVPPARAVALADRLADAARAAGATPAYVDCNAVAPETARRIAEIAAAAGLAFTDGGIVGPAPSVDGEQPRIYVSGPHAAASAALGQRGLDVRVVSTTVGDASAVKICYAALTKGVTALSTELTVAATALGVTDTLWAELADSQPQLFGRLQRQIPAAVPKAHRWVGEMAEIAKTFAACGLTPKLFEGAAELYDFVARNAPANADEGFEQTTRALAAALPRTD